MNLIHVNYTCIPPLIGACRMALQDAGIEVYHAEDIEGGKTLYGVTPEDNASVALARCACELTDPATVERLDRTPADEVTVSIRQAQETYDDIPGGRWLRPLVMKAVPA